MSESSTPEERTEMPTDRRMGKLRSEGALFISQDTVQLASLVAGLYLLIWLWNWLYEDLHIVLVKSFTMAGDRTELTVAALHEGFLKLLLLIAPHILLLAGGVSIVASLAVFLQTDWNVKEKKIKFDFNFLNPISGIMKIFSVQGFVVTGKAILKLAIILPIAYYALMEKAPLMLGLMHLSIEQTLEFTSDTMLWIFWKIFNVLFVFAVFDYVWGKFQWLKQNKMTKSEVKDERKSVEGDEETKRKIIHKGMSRIALRLKTSVPKAHVIVTNPTHISIALRYDRASDAAPVVVAKGKGFMALRIREIAREHGIPIVERKPVARALFESTEVGAIIPREMFRAVAEILAYVYRLKNPYAQRAQQAS
jgi:flagellar biosynthetic protein FlhB